MITIKVNFNIYDRKFIKFLYMWHFIFIMLKLRLRKFKIKNGLKKITYWIK